MHDNFGAIREFTRALKLQKNAIQPRFKRGVAHYKEREEEEALRDIDTVLGLEPAGAEAFIIRSMKFQIQMDFRGAAEEATRAIHLDPLNGAAYYLRGYNRFDLQDYRGAIEDLTHCLSLPYPYKSKVYNCRGWCFKIIGEIEKALEDFTISGRLNVRYTKPYVNKAIVLSADKSRRPAICEEEVYLTEYLAKTEETDLGAIYYTRAAIRQQWEKYEEAIEDYQRSITHGYHSLHKAHVSIGWCYEKLQKYERAITEYNKALVIKPTYSIAIEHRAGAKCRIDSKAAEEDCKLAIEINPKNLSFSYRYLAAVTADNGDYNFAINTLSQGLEVNPLDTDMLVNRAGYHTCLGKFAMAISDYDLCLKHRPDTFEAWKYRANARYAAGEIEGAITDYEKAISFEESDCMVYSNCAMAFLSLGMFEMARSHLKKALHLRSSQPHLSTIRSNMDMVKNIERNSCLEKLFEPMFFIDPVFEKDIDKRMREVTLKSIVSYLNLKTNPMTSQGDLLREKVCGDRDTNVPRGDMDT